jgi:hypothetical protein
MENGGRGILGELKESVYIGGIDRDVDPRF